MFSKAVLLCTLLSVAFAAVRPSGPWRIANLGANAGISDDLDGLSATFAPSIRQGVYDFELHPVSHEKYGLEALWRSGNKPVQVNATLPGQRVALGSGGPPTTFQYQRIWPKDRRLRGNQLAQGRQCFLIKTLDQKLAWSTRNPTVGTFGAIPVTLARFDPKDDRQIFCFKHLKSF